MFSQHCLKRTVSQNKSAPSTLETGNSRWVPNMGCMGVTPNFSPELSQQFLHCLNSMGRGIIKQENDTFTQYAQPCAWDGFL
ncbi:hypothetical protein TNCV_181201 [Trichonephila clavipes]|nr:hypothetical protein TNCV_181201 [Trichonephila clavipes]